MHTCKVPISNFFFHFKVIKNLSQGGTEASPPKKIKPVKVNSPSKVFLTTFEQKYLSIHHIDVSAIPTDKVSVCTSVKLVAAGSGK